MRLSREITDHPLCKKVTALVLLLFLVTVLCFEFRKSFLLSFCHFGQVRELMDEEMLQDVEIHFR